MTEQRRQSTVRPNARALHVLAAMFDAAYGEEDAKLWVSADEVAHSLYAELPTRAAQTLGRELRRLEDRGLVETRVEWGGYRMYRPAERVRALLLPREQRSAAGQETGK